VLAYCYTCADGKFSYYRKLVKATVKADRFHWLQTVDENLKSHPKQFWKNVSQIRKKSADLTHLDMDGVVLNKPRDIAEALLSIWFIVSSSCYGTSSSVNQRAENLHLAPVSNSDV
jgi:hypothetical protein